jgi:hypothetical protein
MPKSPEEMMAAIMRNLVARTGRSEQEWAAIGAAVPAGKFTERLKFLQQTQGLGRGQAQAVLWYGEHGADYAPTSYDQLVAAQYAGRRAALRPIFDAVLKAAQTLGDDVEIGARQTYVSFNHGRQFAIVRAMTQTTADVGLVLPGEPIGGRLKRPGSLGSDRLTHKVTLRAVDDVDNELRGWLRRACERA